MAFEIVSFTDRERQHFYYFVDRFNVSTNLRFYEAMFQLPNQEEELPVVLDIPSELEIFRFKVHVQNLGTFMFFLEKSAFVPHKDKLFANIKKLKDIENDDEKKLSLLLKNMSKEKPLLIAFYDERNEEFDFTEFRKPFLREHLYCKVFVFRKAHIEEARILQKKAQKNEYLEAIKKTGRGIKVAAVSTGHFFKKTGQFIAKCCRGIANASKWTYHKVLTPIGRFFKKAGKVTWKGLKKICIPLGKFFAKLGIWIWVGLKYIGRQLKRFFVLIGRSISKVFPRLLPFTKKVFIKISHGIKIASIFLWKEIKRFGIFMGRFFKAFGIIAWNIIKVLSLLIWRGLKALGKLIWKGLKKIGILLGKKLKQLFILIGHGFKNLPKYLEWKSDYTFYVIFSLLFAFALMCGICWTLNNDGLSVFFFAMTALFMLICVYATYIQRHDHKDWTITAKNTLSPNLAIFLGLLVGVISSYFTAQAIIKVPEGTTLDFGLALWITVGASGFLLIMLNFTPFIIHKFKTNSAKKQTVEKRKEPAKVEQNQEIAGENLYNDNQNQE